MSNTNPPDTVSPNPDEKTSAMFVSLVLQQTNMASIFLGLAPHPESGKVERDLDHAQYFIDQLEMLEIKTRGNLDQHEAALLKRGLTTLRLAFVEAVSKPAEPSPAAGPKAEGAPPPPEAAAQPAPDPASTPTASDDSKKKFSKKY